MSKRNGKAARRNGPPRGHYQADVVYHVDQMEGFDEPHHPLPPQHGTPGKKRSAKAKKVRVSAQQGNGYPYPGSSGYDVLEGWSESSSPMTTPARPATAGTHHARSTPRRRVTKKRPGTPGREGSPSHMNGDVPPDLRFDKALSERDRLIQDLKTRLQQEMEVSDRYAKKLEVARSKLVKAAELERGAERWKSKKEFLLQQISELEEENARLDKANTRLEAENKRALARGGSNAHSPSETATSTAGVSSDEEKNVQRAREEGERTARELRDRIATLESELSQATAKVRRLEDDLAAEQRQRENVDTELSSAKDEVERLKKQVEDSANHPATSASDNTDALAQKDKDLDELRASIAKKEQTEKELRERNRKMEGTIDDLRSQLGSEETKNESLSTDLEQKKKDYDDLNASHRRVKDRVVDLQDELDSMRKQQANSNATGLAPQDNGPPSGTSSIHVPLVSPPHSPPPASSREFAGAAPVSLGGVSVSSDSDPVPVHRSFRQSRKPNRDGGQDPDDAVRSPTRSVSPPPPTNITLTMGGNRTSSKGGGDSEDVAALKTKIANLEKRLSAAKVFAMMHANCTKTVSSIPGDSSSSAPGHRSTTPSETTDAEMPSLRSRNVIEINEKWSAKYKRMRGRWQESEAQVSELQILLSQATLAKQLAEEKFASLTVQHSGLLADLKRSQEELHKERERFRRDVLAAVRDSAARTGPKSRAGTLSNKLVESYEREIIGLREELKKLQGDLDFKDQLIDELDAVIIKLKTHNEDLRTRLSQQRERQQGKTGKSSGSGAGEVSDPLNETMPPAVKIPPSPELMPEIIMGIDTKSLNTSHPTVVPLSANLLGPRVTSAQSDRVPQSAGNGTGANGAGAASRTLSTPTGGRNPAEIAMNNNARSRVSAVGSSDLHSQSEADRARERTRHLLNDSAWAPT